MTKSTRRQGKLRAIDSPNRHELPVGDDWSTTVDAWMSPVVFLFALALRLTHLFVMRHSVLYAALVADGWKYDRWGMEIAGGNWLGNEVFYQTPLYPYLLGSIYSVFGHEVWWVRIAQAVGGAVACALLASTGRRLFDARAGWFAGILLAVYPPAIFFDGIVQKASLDLLIACLLLFSISACQARLGFWRVCCVGAVLGAFILNRENAAALFPVLLVWLVVEARKGRKVLLSRLAAYLLGLGVVLLPVGFRNLYVGGEFLLTTSQMGPNFYIGNHRGASGGYESLRPLRGDPRYESDDARLLAEEAVGRKLSPSEISNYWMKRTWGEIWDQPTGWLRLLGWKTLLTFHAWEQTDAESVRAHVKESIVLRLPNFVWNFGILVPLATVGIWLTRRDWRRIWIYHALLVVFALAVVLFYVFSRYRYPLVPLFVLFAAAGMARSWELIRSSAAGGGREVLLGCVWGALVAVAGHWPMGNMGDDEVTYVNVGTALLDDGRPREAVAALLRAVALKPEFGGTYVNLGLAYLALGDDRAAESQFQRAIALDPNLAAGYFSLGRIHAKRGELVAAKKALTRAAEIDPLLAEPHHLLGQIHGREGNWREAANSLIQAANRDPHSDKILNDLVAARLQAGQVGQAIEDLRAFIGREKNVTPVVNNLAWILATYPDPSVRNPKEALLLAERVNDSAPDQPAFLDTLAAAQAAGGDFPKATLTVRQAAKMAREKGQTQLADTLESRGKRYEERKPFLDESLLPATP
ncbi:MAG: tetratricopeptide repeat protein [Planctomycetota bacterium]